MDSAPVTGIIDFELYLLMTMKRRMTMLDKVSVLEATLAERAISISTAERAHEQVGQVLSDGSTRFASIKTMVGQADSDVGPVTFGSELWPGFEFSAAADGKADLESARYRRVDRVVPQIDSPAQLLPWGVDVDGFIARFGPMTTGQQWPLFDSALPGYEEYEFSWNGARHGAGFNWGLFLFSAPYWD